MTNTLPSSGPTGLSRLMAQLNSSSFQSLPKEEKLENAEMLAEDELKRAKEQDDTKAISAMIDNWYVACKAQRVTEEQQWYKNLDMAQGRQFTVWDPTRKTMVDLPTLDYEPRLAVNIIEPVVRTELAKTGSTHPTASVSPASNDDADIMAALAGEQTWQWFYDTSDFQVKIFSVANWWRLHTGNGFTKMYYDPNCIDTAATEAAEKKMEEEIEAMTAAGQPPMNPDIEIPPVKGKIRAQAVTPFNLYVPDLLEPDIQEQSYILHVYTMPIEQARIAYKGYVSEDWNPQPILSTALLDPSHLGLKGGNSAKPDATLVIEAWVKPGFTPKMPEGGLVIKVGNEIVAMSRDGIPYDHGQYPFGHLTSIDTGRFYRKSVIQSITPLQDEINRTYSQLIKAKNLKVKPQMFYDAGSVDVRKVQSKAGMWIPVQLGFKNPTAVPVQDLPTFIVDFIDKIKLQIDDLTGQHQVSRSQAPGANTPASAISLLQETDDNYLSPTFDSIVLCLKTMAQQFLQLAVQYWDVARFVKIVGNDRSVDAKILDGSDLQGGTDIRIDSNSALPQSKSARIATITDWIEKNIITAADGLEAMEMGTLGKVFNKIKLDEDAARRENLTMRDIDLNELAQWNAQQQADQQIKQMQAQQETSESALQEAYMSATDPTSFQTPSSPTMPPAQQALQTPAENPLDTSLRAGQAASVQPGASAPPQPGELVGSSVPAAPLPDNPIFFPINWYDNDQVHMAMHREHANSQAYQSYDPEIKKVFEDHYYAHMNRSLNIQALTAQRQSAQAAQEAAMMAQQAPTVAQTARVGGKNQYAGQQFTQ